MPRSPASGLLLLSLFSATCAFAGPASTQTTGWAGYERVQAVRSQAEALSKKDAPEADLRQATAKLEDMLVYLDTPEMRELSRGNTSLHFRGHDVRADLAALYCRLNMHEQAIAALQAAQQFSWTPGFIQGYGLDKDCASLSADPRFQRIIKTAELPNRLWQSLGQDVPYRPKLTVAERIAGLTTFWTEARQNFVYFDQVPDLDWNKVYMEYLPKVIAAETTRDYYRVMMQLAPLLKDGHTNIYPPNELANQFYARPPVKTVLVEDKVIVEKVNDADLAQRLHVGDEIVAIDGIPVQRYAEQHIAPFVSSSTPQDRTLRMFTYQLLMGEAKTPVKLTLRDQRGRQREEALARSGYKPAKSPAPFAFRMLPDGVAYFALDHFESDAGVKAFERALPEIMNAKVLIIDVRGNGGGSTEFGHAVLRYLSPEEPRGAISYVRQDEALPRAQGQTFVRWNPVPELPVGSRQVKTPIFSGKVAVLQGPRTFSAGEDFLVAYNAMKRGITVGEATGGSTGQPLMLALPGGGQARICIKRDVQPDGTQFVGLGIAPSVIESQTVASIRAGRDPVLERAIAELRAGPGS